MLGAAENMVWLKLDAGLFSSPDFQDLLEDAGILGGMIWIYCLCRAKERGNGGFLTRADFSERHIRRVMQLSDTHTFEQIEDACQFVFDQFLEGVPGGGYQIQKWHKYQSDRTNAERQARHREKKESNDSNALRNGDNGSNDIEESRVEESRVEESRKEKEYSADVHRLCALLLAEMNTVKPDCKEKAVLDSWLVDMDRLIRIDGREPEAIKGVIQWVCKDSFWAGNVRSPGKLRKQFDRLEIASGAIDGNLTDSTPKHETKFERIRRTTQAHCEAAEREEAEGVEVGSFLQLGEKT